MKKATVDLIGCESIHDLHRRIREGLDFPDYYGENLDAFWDCISMDCDADFVTLIGSNSVADDLKPTLAKIVELLEKNKQFWENSDSPFDYEMIN